MSKNYGPRRGLSHSERIIRAIKMARMRFSDDQRFLEELHKILIRERILTEKEFGLFDRLRVDNDGDDKDESYEDE